MAVPADRSKMVSNAMLCFNCLSPGHQENQCFYGSPGSCHKCGRKHNNKLHNDNKVAEDPHEH